jgi:hypothetical protein
VSSLALLLGMLGDGKACLREDSVVSILEYSAGYTYRYFRRYALTKIRSACISITS